MPTMGTIQPTTGELVLQFVIGLLGSWFLCMLLRRSWQQEDLARERRRQERTRDTEALLLLFNEHCLEVDSFCDEEHPLLNGTQNTEQASVGPDASETPICAICMQQLATTSPQETAPAGSQSTVNSQAGPLLEDAEASAGRTRVIRFACPGGHRFHYECIEAWIRRGRSTCPVCKFDLRALSAAPSNNPEPG